MKDVSANPPMVFRLVGKMSEVIGRVLSEPIKSLIMLSLWPEKI